MIRFRFCGKLLSLQKWYLGIIQNIKQSWYKAAFILSRKIDTKNYALDQITYSFDRKKYEKLKLLLVVMVIDDVFRQLMYIT